MIVHNEYEFDSNNCVELVEYDIKDNKFCVQGKIKGKDFGLDHPTIESAREQYYCTVRIIRQIN